VNEIALTQIHLHRPFCLLF